MAAPSHVPAKPGFNPLYLQVKQQLIDRIDAGEWPPGGVLPSEHALARELDVSQGTVRKALDVLASENLLVRQQGRGTFVAEHDADRTLFQFFMLTSDDGVRRFPETVHAELSQVQASADERLQLGLAAATRVWKIVRHRILENSAPIIEHITLSAKTFPKLDRFQPLPNNVYGLYEREFGVKVARADEQVKAVACSPDHAGVLQCETGAPLLQIDRVAFGLTGDVAELRRSLCRADTVHYRSSLR